MYSTITYYIEHLLTDPLWLLTQPVLLAPILVITAGFCYAQYKVGAELSNYIKAVSDLPREADVERYYVYRAHEELQKRVQLFRRSALLDVVFLLLGVAWGLWTSVIIFTCVVLSNYRYFAIMTRAQNELGRSDVS